MCSELQQKLQNNVSWHCSGAFIITFEQFHPHIPAQHQATVFICNVEHVFGCRETNRITSLPRLK